MSAGKKLLVINPYFGRPPAYFGLFIESCRRNSRVDFLFVVDFSVEPQWRAPNVRFEAMTFDELRQRIAGLFDFEISLPVPYKICDFKPTYGEVFADFLRTYDYWGHCDFDMIFGDLTPVLQRMNRGDYDKIFRRGHLTLYRNTERVNTFYRSAQAGAKYRDAFTRPDICNFDETTGVDRLFVEAGFSVCHDELIYDVKPNSAYLRRTVESSGIGRFCVLDERGLRSGSALGGAERDFIYIHLQKRPLDIRGERGEGKLLYLDQFGFEWVRPEAVRGLSLRALLPNWLHLGRRVKRRLTA